MMQTSIYSLLAFADRAGLELLVWSWQALIILVCVWAGLKLFRVKTPALRQQIWLIGLLAVITMPLCPPLFPKSTLIQQQRWSGGSTLSRATEFPRLIIDPAAEVRLPLAQYKAIAIAPKNRWLFMVLPAAFCLWFVGAFFTFLHCLRGYRRLRRASQYACPTTLEELGSAVHLPQSVSLRFSTDVRSPVLLGFRHPVILLPHDLIEWTSAEERDAMIGHELAHLARFDHVTNLLPITLKIIFFFHPLVRYACRQLCLEREIACDDRVINHGADAALYAESLVKAAERSLKGKLDDLASYSFHQPAFFTTKQALERRIEMILNTDRVRVLARGWRYLILPALLIFALAGLLVPARPTTAQQLQKRLDDAAASVKDGSLKELLGKYMADPATYDNLVETVLSESGAPQREQALHQLVESQQEWATAALGEIYDKTDDITLRTNLIGYLGGRRALSKLLALAIEEPNAQLRQQAVRQLLEMEGDGTADTLIQLYEGVGESSVKESIIRSFGQRDDIGGLHQLGDIEKDLALRQLMVQQLEWLVSNTNSEDRRREAMEELQAIKLGSVKRSAQVEIAESKNVVGIVSDDSTKDSGNDPRSMKSKLVEIRLNPASEHTGFANVSCILCHSGKFEQTKFALRSFMNDPAAVAEVLRKAPNQTNIVLALLRETFDATIRHDTDFLERALANEFQSFGPYNEVNNKDQIIAEVNNNKLKIDWDEIGDLSLNGGGNSMVATFVGTPFYQEEGNEKKRQYRYTILCLKRRGGWQIVSMHRSPVLGR
jgi:beta-lactamase regulating signal transducer with metallopeptidase domain